MIGEVPKGRLNTQICGKRKCSESHRSDALYQGPTLVGPFRPNKDWALAPALFSQVSVAVGVLLGGIDQSCFDRVLNDIFAMLQKTAIAGAKSPILSQS